LNFSFVPERKETKMGNCQDSEVIIVTEYDKDNEEEERRADRKIKIREYEEKDGVSRTLARMKKQQELADARRKEQAERISRLAGKKFDAEKLATSGGSENYMTYTGSSGSGYASNNYTQSNQSSTQSNQSSTQSSTYRGNQSTTVRTSHRSTNLFPLHPFGMGRRF
jgi:hypothetical protein